MIFRFRILIVYLQFELGVLTIICDVHVVNLSLLLIIVAHAKHITYAYLKAYSFIIQKMMN